MDKLCIIFLTLLLAGCNGRKGGNHLKIPARPDTLRTTLMIEGSQEGIKMYLFEAPADFPLYFSTYIPLEMRTDTSQFKWGKSINIFAAFGGYLNTNARLSAVIFTPVIKEEEARRRAGNKALSFQGVRTGTTTLPWAETVYELRGKNSGFLALGEKKGIWFYIMAVYPPEYGDGMGPRVALILDQWRWRSGEPLAATGSEEKNEKL